MSAESVTLARQKRKKELVEIMGGKCILCGYNKCIAALEFHHINKKEKEYGLSNGNCHSWEEDIKELKKCALVCSNCHKEIEVFNLETYCSFDEEKFQEINKQKQNTEYKCQRCGAEITRGARFCHNCWTFLNRKIERPSREELKDLIRANTFTIVGKMFNVADNTIRSWCDDYKLPRRIKDILNYSDDEWKNI